MFRTIKLKLPYDKSLIETGKQFKEACQKVLDYGFSAKVFNKNKLNRETYKAIREEIPTLPSSLVQTARDTASEILKRIEFKIKPHKKSLTIRYDRRSFKFYPDSRTISLTTVAGRLVFPIAYSPIIDKYRGEYTNAELTVYEKHKRIFIMVQVEVPDIEVNKEIKDGRVVGIDRGIKNIAVLSNNMFFNSKELRNIKGRYQYNKAKLQHVGTRSAHRKLRELSGRERRLVLNTNHVISKHIVGNLPFDIIALEELESARMKKKGNGKTFNKMLGTWSPNQLARFIEYKAQDVDKTVIYVNPKYTSQKCSECGYIDKRNRNGTIFHCINCNFQLHADLNASRNIEILGKSEYFRLLSTSQSLRFDEDTSTGVRETSNKPHPLG